MAGSVSRIGLAIAPSIVRGGDLPSDLEHPMQEAIAEMLSWEASLIPSIRVIDPVLLNTNLEKSGWSGRTDLTETEIEDGRTASRQLDADAVVFTRFVHSAGIVDWQVALAYRRETKDLSQRLFGRSREDDFILQIRKRALAYVDTLGIQVPPAAYQIVNSRGNVNWEALREYAMGIRDQEAGQNEEALRHYNEALRRAPFLPSLQVRLKKLEMELQSSR
jgi:hypothetical protein